MVLLNNIWSFFLGLVTTLFLIIPILGYFDLYEPRPYSRVDRLQLYFEGGKVDGDIRYEANFYKNSDCEFIRYKVAGYDLFRWIEVQSEDPGGEKGDRLSGWQTLNLRIKGEPRYTKYEIRLEHDCGEDNPRVGTIFDSFKYEDVGERGNDLSLDLSMLLDVFR